MSFFVGDPHDSTSESDAGTNTESVIVVNPRDRLTARQLQPDHDVAGSTSSLSSTFHALWSYFTGNAGDDETGEDRKSDIDDGTLHLSSSFQEGIGEKTEQIQAHYDEYNEPGVAVSAPSAFRFPSTASLLEERDMYAALNSDHGSVTSESGPKIVDQETSPCSTLQCKHLWSESQIRIQFQFYL